MDPQVFIDCELDQLDALAKSYKKRGWRLANLCGSTVGEKVELLCSFSLGEELENLRILIDNGQKVPAVSPLFPNAFVFENEAHDLYGVDFVGCIIDYQGHLYAPSIPTPMNPSSLAAREFLAVDEGKLEEGSSVESESDEGNSVADEGKLVEGASDEGKLASGVDSAVEEEVSRG